VPEIASTKLSIDSRLLPRGGARVLDVGCGDGRHVAAAVERSCRAVGVDYDVAALRAARAQTRGRADLIVADATHLPFRDGTFDAAICTETLEHLPDDTGAMHELARVVRPGGLLLGAVPSHFTELLYWRLSRGYRDAPGGHVRIYRPRALAASLRRAGLHVSDVRYAHFIDSLIWLRFCLTDFLRPRRRRSPFAQAVALAIASERRVPGWRQAIRAALPASRFMSAVDTAGALVWPKSMIFVAEKRAAIRDRASREDARIGVASR
jgi:SAM-dependent methyltransferase